MSSGNDRKSEDNILPLGPQTAAAQKIAKIERYWNRIRANRLVPSRCEIDPRGLEGVLSHAFILERIAGGLARFRIAGSHLTEVTGLDLRQMPISALFTHGSRPALSDALIAVFDEPALARMAVTSPSGFGRSTLQGEMVLLPLRSDLGDIDRILGGMVFEGVVGRTPRRIEIAGETRRSLTGYAGQAHAARAPATPARRPVSIDLTPGRPGAPKGHGHLRLVVSND
jgi:hypothetical protein